MVVENAEGNDQMKKILLGASEGKESCKISNLRTANQCHYVCIFSGNQNSKKKNWKQENYIYPEFWEWQEIQTYPVNRQFHTL